MDGLSAAEVDVRDMLCAQALAVVAQAAGRAADGPLAVRYNAADVRRDLLTWAEQTGRLAEEPESGLLRLARRPPR
jgi:hypothetical protein